MAAGQSVKALLALLAATAVVTLAAPARAEPAGPPAGCKTERGWTFRDWVTPEYDLPERSWIAWSPSKVPYTDATGNTRQVPLVFEADIAPHIGIVGLAAWGHPHVQCGWRWKLSWVFTPEVRLRMLDAYSAPVIPPSFMPRPFQFQVLGRRFVPDDSDSERGNGMEEDYVVTITAWGHHSNGQTGCFYRNQTFDPTTMSCSPVGNGPLNERDGSFSTNYLELAAGYRRAWRATLAQGPENGLFVDTGLQYHPLDYLPGGQDAEQAALWGRWHYWAHGELTQTVGPCRGLFEVNVQKVLDRVVPASQGGPEHTTTVRGQASLLMPEWLGTGLFVMGEYGQDTYNILFTQTVKRVLVGFVVDWSRGVARPRQLHDDTPVPAATRQPGAPPPTAGAAPY
jgi:hypothetical protein